MSTEPTTLGLIVNNLPNDLSGAAGSAICDQSLPEREDIVLKPSREFPRKLTVEWSALGVKVSVNAPNFQWLMFVRLDHKQLSLAAQRMESDPQWIIYTLRAGPSSSFCVSPSEFETLAAKLEPRGVKVTRP